MNRFVLGFDRHDPIAFDVKRIEGRRYHPRVKYWSTPASLRAWKLLRSFGFEMMEYGGGRDYVSWLERGCPIHEEKFSAPLDLFEYQRHGVARLYCKSKMILGDEPGLGKTYQAIELARRRENTKQLVIAPKVVLEQWRDSVHKRYAQVDEAREIRLRAPSWEKGWNIVNYEFLNKLEPLKDGSFDLFVDEAHLCTNTKTRRTKLATSLAAQARRTLLLTGTVPSRPVKLWPLLVMCGEREPKEFFPFALRYCGAERNDFGWDFSGATHLDELRDELQHVMLRRTKEEVMSNLPPILHTTLKVAPSTGTVGDRSRILSLDTDIFEQLQRGHSLGGLSEFQRLRVLTSKQKVPTTVEYVQSLGAQRVVIFCEFRETMNAIQQGLTKGGPDSEGWTMVQQIHGDIKEDERRFAIGMFQHADGCALIVQSGVAGLALDGLQVANTGIIHDLPWTNDQMTQIVSRLQRTGQEHDSVHIVTVQSTSAVEERMIEAIREGRELSEVMYGRRD